MANYDNRLGEWFKQVERSAQELRKKKTDDIPEEPRAVVKTEPIISEPAAEVIAQPIQEAPAAHRTESSVATIDMAGEETVGEPHVHIQTASATQEMPTSAPRKSAPMLFDDADVPPVEDFFSFMGHKSEPEKTEFEPPVSPIIGSEGTGEPRPIVSDNAAEPVVEPVKAETSSEVKQPVAQQNSLQENWDRMPHHLQTLFGIAGEEVAQNSYKAFKESRGDLIQRLLDPPLTLEEAARILNVCPTTVRRYTNRGVLAHFRTAGNQRRFRLSDVLSFMESNGRNLKDTE
jgi:excisionase family DNA binding protein